jgi:tetratricopeptide (TPR) repeat protein
MQIVTSLDAFWMQARYFREGLLWLDQSLAVATDDAPVRLRARAQGAILACARAVGELQRAMEAGEAALTLYRDLNEPRALGLVLGSLAMAARDLGRRAEARAYVDEAIQVSRGAGFAPALGSALFAKGVFALEHGDFQAARAAGEEVLEHRNRHTPDILLGALALLGGVALAEGQYSTAITRPEEGAQLQELASGSSTWGDPAHGLAIAALAMGDLTRARDICARGLEFVRDNSRSTVAEAFCLAGLGEVAFYEGDLERAEADHHRALEMLERSGWQLYVPEQLAAFARIALARADTDRATRLLGASDALREQLGINVIVLEWPRPDEAIAAARAALDDDQFSTAWAAGRAMSHHNAVTYALHDG